MRDQYRLDAAIVKYYSKVEQPMLPGIQRNPVFAGIAELLVKVVIWLMAVFPTILFVSWLTDLPTPLESLIEPKLRAASFLPSFYQSSMGVVMIAGVCALAWWAVARAWKPSSPREVLRFRKIWSMLSIVFTCLIIGAFYYVVLRNAGPVTMITRAVFFAGYALMSWLFFVASVLVFSPLTVISEIPGGPYVAELKRR